ncbi:MULTISPECIES: hypothetical protein [unclassified Lentimonas]|uniref:hypothetical protein n=1 Tax=unclassified Lentimonas TaxID=2630993 RepID=UPI001329C67B|nr:MULTISPECIES: hypothetical protein [unclassified Lentimonas]CAA6679044.1 Unannotated [Lentimonas sp. CC4]CAA6684216.1 Unannotated [Lentimonas sp. CC6]CAA7076411.1 Unannotated [Lentimonas sp. CC4]CAA7171836.1 Unannotated [Lentimonas sp. CC21]CAA7183166.1 Unannotated [Lentimonas sp. CC8]
MNQSIERFLLWACLAQVFAWVVARFLPGILTYVLLRSGAESAYSSIYLTSILGVLVSLPLQVVCGVWLKEESDRLGVNSRIWFWTGFFFKFIGVIVFYVYLTFCRTQKNQSIEGGAS